RATCTSLFFLMATAATEISTLSLHDALPISANFSTSCHWVWLSSTLRRRSWRSRSSPAGAAAVRRRAAPSHSATSPTARAGSARSEEHTSELQSRSDLVCRLLLEKKKRQQST